MDERERDKFYTAPSADEDDGDYELEPPDPEVLAAEERRAQEAVEATRAAIDIDEIYRDLERDRGREILEGWLRGFRFRFQVKHVLIVTAVLAMLLTLAHHGMLGTALVLAFMAAVAGLYLYLQWQEKKHRDEADRRRAEMYARRRARTDQPQPAGADSVASVAPPPSPTLDGPEEPLREQRPAERFRVQFSLRQLLLAMTAAAVILGTVRVLGGPANTATVLGLVALAGLVIHAIGFEPPQTLALGWWLILVMYLLMSIVAALGGGLA